MLRVQLLILNNFINCCYSYLNEKKKKHWIESVSPALTIPFLIMTTDDTSHHEWLSNFWSAEFFRLSSFCSPIRFILFLLQNGLEENARIFSQVEQEEGDSDGDDNPEHRSCQNVGGVVLEIGHACQADVNRKNKRCKLNFEEKFKIAEQKNKFLMIIDDN